MIRSFETRNMPAMNMLEPFGINSQLAGLAPRDAELIRVLIAKYRRYLGQGRGREAHGAASALLLVWHSVKPSAPTSEVDLDVSGPVPFADVEHHTVYPATPQPAVKDALQQMLPRSHPSLQKSAETQAVARP